jgi:hypothetical protein
MRSPLGLLLPLNLKADGPRWVLLVHLQVHNASDDLPRCKLLLGQLQVHVSILLFVLRILTPHLLLCKFLLSS